METRLRKRERKRERLVIDGASYPLIPRDNAVQGALRLLVRGAR